MFSKNTRTARTSAEERVGIMFHANKTYPSTYRLFVSICLHRGAVCQRVYHVDLQQNGRTRATMLPGRQRLVSSAVLNITTSVQSHHPVPWQWHAAPVHGADVIDIVPRPVQVTITNRSYCFTAVLRPVASCTRLRS